MHVNLKFQGLTVSRVLRAAAIARHSDLDAAGVAAERWGHESPAAQVLRKSAISSDWGNALAGTTDAAEFMRAVSEREILSRLPGLRRVPPYVRHIAATAGATAGFVESGARIPVTGMTLSPESLTPKRVAGIIVLTNETLKSASVESENLLQTDLIRAAADATDFALLAPSNIGDDATPASITHDATTIGATGDAAFDFGALVTLFEGDLLNAAFVMHPRIAAQLNLTGGEAFRDVGATGGVLLGMPVLTSRAVPEDTSGSLVALIDGSAVAAAEDPPEFQTSEAATIQLSSAPDDPIPGDYAVSMFQAECSALKITRRIVWRRVRPGAVVCLTGVDYSGT